LFNGQILCQGQNTDKMAENGEIFAYVKKKQYLCSRFAAERVARDVE
jgi:hypothetical protein